MPGRRGRPALTEALDRETWAALRRCIDAPSLEAREASMLSVPELVRDVQAINPSLARRNKKQLEQSIERVLAAINLDQADEKENMDVTEDDSVDSRAPNMASANAMNQDIVRAWNPTQTSAPQTATGQASSKSAAEHSKSRKGESHGEPPAKRRKATAEIKHTPPENVDLSKLGGIDLIIGELTDSIAFQVRFADILVANNCQQVNHILLHGPPGSGKTMIVSAFAAEMKIPFINISAPSIVSGMSGESEKALRDHFEEAKRIAPCLLFIDEIDAITPKRENAQREMEKRIVAQLLTCMDDLVISHTGRKPVVVLAATNRPDSLDPALRRAGRFGKEINVTVPTQMQRQEILQALTRERTLGSDIDLQILAKRTPGFVGADLNDLVDTAVSSAARRYKSQVMSEAHIDTDFEEDSDAGPKLRELRQLLRLSPQSMDSSLWSIQITSDDFEKALVSVQPSAKREGFATIPGTTWKDVGALEKVRDELTMAIVWPINYPERYTRAGVTTPTGVLLWGPPGCGKTLLAKAVANESRANFISVKGPELLNKYVGESERAMRQVFARARSSIPCVIFFDELDALVPKRNDSQNEASSRMVNTLLTELDGLDARKEIYVIGATNRPDLIDTALLRPGRFGKLLFVDLPGAEERVEILRTLLGPRDIDGVDDIARECRGFSGADLENLVRRAGLEAVRRNDVLRAADFDIAKREERPSVRNYAEYTALKAGMMHESGST